MNLKTHQYNTDMGKKILGVIALVAIAAATGWNYQQNKQEVEFSDLALANVEALAYNESSEHCGDDFTTMRCMTSGTVWMDMYHIW